MPWNLGTFARFFGATGWQDDKAAAINIVSSRHDSHDQDISDGINACLTRDNQAKPSSDFRPVSDSTLSLGSASLQWLRLFLTGNVSIPDAAGNVSYWARTAAEIAAGVTPTNYSYPSHIASGRVLLERYGGAGDNATYNNTAFTNAILVAGQVDAPIGLLGGSTAIYLVGSATPGAGLGLTLTGTGQAAAGIGPPVGGVSAQGCRIVGLNGRPTIKFVNLGASVDCIAMGGSQRPQVELRNLQIDANNTGRDGVVITGSNAPIIDNVLIQNTVRDGLVLAPANSNFIEKLKAKTLMFRFVGRHAITMSLSGSASYGAYVNECTWEHVELRGCAQVTPGGTFCYMAAAAGAGSGAKIANHLWLDADIDCIYNGSGNVPAATPFYTDSAVVQNFTILGGGWESTGAVNPGVSSFTGSISGTTLTISAVSAGKPSIASVLVGAGITTGTKIVGFLSVNPDGTGTYTVNNSQTVGSESMTCGGYGCTIINTGTWAGLAAMGVLTNSFWGSGVSSIPYDPLISTIYDFNFSFSRAWLTKIAALFTQPALIEDLNLWENKNVFGASMTLKKYHVKNSSAAPTAQTDGTPLDGMLHAQVTGATSSTCHLQFPLALISPVPQGDFVHSFILAISYSQFTNFNGNISRVYLVQVAPNLTTCLATQIVDASSANQVSSVSVSIVSTTTLDIAITTGTTFGTAGGNTTIYGTLCRGGFVA